MRSKRKNCDTIVLSSDSDSNDTAVHRTTKKPRHNPPSSSSCLQTSTYTRKPHSQELETQGQHKTVSKSSCQKKSSCYSSIASLDNSDSDSDSCEQFEVQSQQFRSPVTVSSVSSSQSKLTQESGMLLDSVELPSDKELQREMKKKQAEVSRTASLSHLASMSFLCANYSAVSMVLEVKHHHMIT